MKRFAAILLMLTLSLYGWDKPLEKHPTQEVERLKQKAEKMKEEDRGHTYSEICLQLAEEAGEHYNDGNADKAVASVKQLLEYAQKVADIAKVKDKKVKQSEINIRKCSRRLDEIRRTVTLEEHPPLEDAIKKLDSLRDDLLKVLFRN